ncbi:hypothetical protein STEG23_033873 [Scotinomys teguina]
MKSNTSQYFRVYIKGLNKFVYQQRGLGPIEEDTILVIDPNNAAIVQSSGKNLFYLPHGLSIDKDGNYWVTDVALHQVFKLDPQNKEGPLLILGRSMQPGSDQNHFCQPTDVAVDPSTGAVFVSDGYCNSRIVQFSPSGKFITQWGEESSGSAPKPGQFSVPHSLALVPHLDQLCVADRENGRIQCFRTDTKEFVREIKHSSFGRNVFAISYVPGLLFVVNGKPYFGDHEPVQGFVLNFTSGEIMDVFKPVRKHFDMPHDIVASEDGNVYIGDAHTNTVWKFTLTEKMEHRSVKKAGIEVPEIKEAEAVVESKMENKPTSSELQKMQEKQKLIKEPGSGVPVVLITTLLVIPVVVLLAIVMIIQWNKSRAFGDSEHKLESSSGRVLGRFRVVCVLMTKKEKEWISHTTRTRQGAASHPGKKRTQEQPVTLRGRGPRSSQSPSEDEPQPLPETQEQPVTLRGRGPRSSQSPSEEEDPGAASHPRRKRTKEQPVTPRGRGSRSTQTPLEQETSPDPSSKAEMGRRQCKSTYNNIKNKTSPESSPPPTPRPEHCNVDKAEENDLKNSLMKMIEEALEGKMKNAIKEIEEKTNKKIGGKP